MDPVVYSLLSTLKRLHGEISNSIEILMEGEEVAPHSSIALEQQIAFLDAKQGTIHHYHELLMKAYYVSARK